MPDETTEPNAESLMTVAEAAKRLRVTPSVVRELIRSQRFCAVYQLSKSRVRIRREDFEEWFRSRRVEPRSPGGAA